MAEVKMRGYGALLLLTKLLTLAGIAGMVMHFAARHPVGAPGSLMRLAALVLPFVLAGTVCVIRKRFFTTG